MPISAYSPPSILLKLKLFVLSLKLFVVIALGLTAAVAAIAALGCLSTVVMAILGFFGLDQATADTVKATLEWWATLPPERQAKLRAGITREREASVLAAWHQLQAPSKPARPSKRPARAAAG